jgi:hypothetical protein
MMTDSAGMSEATAAQLASGGGASTGVTAVDVNVLIEAINRLQQQVTSLQAEKAASGKHPLLATAEQLLVHVAHDHDGTAGHQLALDLVDASANATESGELSAVERISARLAAWLTRHHPGPGENYHAYQAQQIADHHLPDQLDVFTPSPRPLTPVGGGAPVQVVAGSVTG